MLRMRTSRCFVRHERTRSNHMFASKMKANGAIAQRIENSCMYVTCLQPKEEEEEGHLCAFVHWSRMEPPPMFADLEYVWMVRVVYQSVSYLDCISARLRRVYAIYLLFQNLFVMLNCVLVWYGALVPHDGKWVWKTNSSFLHFLSVANIGVGAERKILYSLSKPNAGTALLTDWWP